LNGFSNTSTVMPSASIRRIRAVHRQSAIAWSDRFVMFAATRATVQERSGFDLRLDAPAIPGQRGGAPCRRLLQSLTVATVSRNDGAVESISTEMSCLLPAVDGNACCITAQAMTNLETGSGKKVSGRGLPQSIPADSGATGPAGPGIQAALDAEVGLQADSVAFRCRNRSRRQDRMRQDPSFALPRKLPRTGMKTRA
jgi:hypothetical protein